MEKAAFKLDTYQFKKASIDFNIPNNTELDISFNPKGTFYQKENRYELSFDTIIRCKETGTEVINISCVAYFSFNTAVSLNEIPNFFYSITLFAKKYKLYSQTSRLNKSISCIFSVRNLFLCQTA